MLARLLGIAGIVTLPAAAQPGVVAAHTIEDPNLSADQARAIFVEAGYQVDQLETWDWLNPPVFTFQVHDTSHNRLLLVQVYPDVALAQRGNERRIERGAGADQVSRRCNGV